MLHDPNAIALRLARRADAAAMAELSRDLIEQGLAWRYTPGRMTGLMADPECSVLVADGSHGLEGFAAMHFGDDRAHLVLLCVASARQRQGLGRRLLDWLLASAGVAGVTVVTLELRADNATALAFYRALGFAETALLPGYYDGRVAARRMQCTLSRRSSGG